MAKIIRHLVDEEGGAQTVNFGVANIFFTQFTQCFRRQVIENFRISMVAFTLAKTPKLAAY